MIIKTENSFLEVISKCNVYSISHKIFIEEKSFDNKIILILNQNEL